MENDKSIKGKEEKKDNLEVLSEEANEEKKEDKQTVQENDEEKESEKEAKKTKDKKSSSTVKKNEETYKDDLIDNKSGKDEKFTISDYIDSFIKLVVTDIPIKISVSQLIGVKSDEIERKIKCVDKLSILSEYDVKILSHGVEVYLFPKTEASFSDLTEYTLHILSQVTRLVDFYFELMFEPSKKAIGGEPVPEIEILGLPYKLKEQYNMLNDNEEREVGRLYKTEKIPRHHGFRKGYVWSPYIECFFTSGEWMDFFEGNRTAPERLRSLLGEFYRIPESIYRIPEQRTGRYLNAFIEPNRLTDYLSWFPLSFWVRIESIVKFTIPEIELRPIGVGELIRSIGTRSNQGSVLNAAIEARSTAEVEIDMKTYMMSIFALGYFEIEIMFQDESNSLENILLAFIAKLMFSYRGQGRGEESMLRRESVRKIDRIIYGFLVKYFRDISDGPVDVDDPLRNIQLIEGINLVEGLRTYRDGRGWLSVTRDGGKSNEVSDRFDRYEQPPSFLELGFERESFEDRITWHLGRWTTLQSIIAIFRKLGTRIQSLRGASEYFYEIASKIMRFLFSINEHNARFYQNFFRFTKNELSMHFLTKFERSEYTQDLNQYPIAYINAKSLFYMSKSLPNGEFQPRPLQFEMIRTARRIEREIELFGIYSAMFRDVNSHIQVNNEYTNTFKVRLLMEQIKELDLIRPFLEFIINLAKANQIKFNSLEVNALRNGLEDTAFRRSYHFVMNNKHLFGISESFYVNARYNIPNGDSFRDMNINGSFYTETRNFVRTRLNKIKMTDIFGLTQERKLKNVIVDSRLKNHNINIEVPIPFKIEFGMPKDDSMILELHIKQTGVLKLSEMIKFKQGHYRIIYNEKQSVVPIDDYLDNIPNFLLCSVIFDDNLLYRSLREVDFTSDRFEVALINLSTMEIVDI